MPIRAERSGCDRGRWRTAGLAVLALSLAASACDRGQRSDEVAGAAPQPQAPSVAPPRPLPGGSEEPALPEHGSALVRLSPQGVTLLANEAPRLGVLRELEREARFRLEMAEGATLAGAITLRAVDASLDEVLAQLLQGVPYAVHYGVDEETGARVWSVVAVGQMEVPEASEAAALPSPARRIDGRRAGARRRPVPVEEEREREERRAAAQAAFIGDLESPDPAIRADAAEFMLPDEQGIPLLSKLLAADPNPDVRAAAAKTLGDSRDSPEAVRALVRALRDPDPDVVVASLEALDWIGDEAVAPELEFLLDDPVLRVREAAAETIESLAD